MITQITDRERELACVIADLKAENKLLREAARFALDALKYTLDTDEAWFDVDTAQLMSHRAVDALKEALGKK